VAPPAPVNPSGARFRSSDLYHAVRIIRYRFTHAHPTPGPTYQPLVSLALGPTGQFASSLRSLTALARWSLHARARVRALTRGSNLDRRSWIRWLRRPHTPSRDGFAKEPLGFLGINPPSLEFARRPLESYKRTRDLINNQRFGLNFVFQISKCVYFISFSYELQIEWFELQNVHKNILCSNKLCSSIVCAL
jgi:hypothetical protein